MFKLLMPNKKMKRLNVFPTGKIQLKRFLNTVVTGDVSWFYKYDLELKSQRKDWKGKNSPWQEENKEMQISLLIFFDF